MSYIIGPGGQPILTGQVPMMPAPHYIQMAPPPGTQPVGPPGVAPHKANKNLMTEEKLQEKGLKMLHFR